MSTMDWFRSGLAAAQKQAQEGFAIAQKQAGEAAEKARELAVQASQQAKVLAEQATEKAKVTGDVRVWGCLARAVLCGRASGWCQMAFRNIPAVRLRRSWHMWQRRPGRRRSTSCSSWQLPRRPLPSTRWGAEVLTTHAPGAAGGDVHAF